MDREQEVRHLEQANMHIGRAEKIIDRQLDIIEDLKRRGHDPRGAKSQLETFERILVTMHQHRRIILRCIEDIDAPGR